MKVSEAIDQLAVGDTVWVKGKVLDFDRGGYDRCPLELSLFYEDEWMHENDEISLTKPTAEKVEVSQEFANWVEKVMRWKHDSSWAVKEIAGYGWGAFMHDPGAGDELLPKKYPWVEAVQNNKEKHIKAIYDGYTVKPKRWVVKNEEGYYFVAFSKYAKTPFEGVFSASVTDLVTFDDKSKAEAVAMLVEGSVEEV